MSMEPGVIVGGSAIEHDCTATGRSVGYFIEGILPLCMFSKRPVRITFYGKFGVLKDLPSLRNVW